MYDIPFERVEAVEHPKGAEGLRLTMVMIFQRAVANNYQHILIFEDDIDIIEPQINEVMNVVVKNMPNNYDIIYLGCQLCSTPQGFFSPNLLKGIKNAYATHAAIYSIKVIKKLLTGTTLFSPIDNAIVSNVQKAGNCYCVFPILCSQVVSHSDIYSDQKVMDWRYFIQGKYWKQISAMKLNGTFKR